MYFLPPWSEKTLTPREYSPAMAGWPGSRQSHAARRIRRRETHSPLAGQLLFIFDDAEREEGAVPERGRAMSGLVRESWAGALGREESPSCACALSYLRLPAPITQIRRSARLTSLDSLGATNPESKGAIPPSAPSLRSSSQRPRSSSRRGLLARAQSSVFLSPRGLLRPAGFLQLLSSFRAPCLSPLYSVLRTVVPSPALLVPLLPLRVKRCKLGPPMSVENGEMGTGKYLTLRSKVKWRETFL